MAASYTLTNLINREQAIQRRIDGIPNRPTTLAADDFHRDRSWRTLPERLADLCTALDRLTDEDLAYHFSKDSHEARRIALTAAVMASAPSGFLRSFQSLFRAMLDEQVQDEPSAIDHLRQLGWLRPQTGLVRQPFLEAIHYAILAKTKETIAGDYETKGLDQRVQAWRAERVGPWVERLLPGEDWSSILERATYECYCLVRMDEIFDMVADYPDSHVAVEELREVLAITKMHSDIGDRLRESLVRRLNHPGANTAQIIDVYIATIKVLSVIDPSDRLLGVVAEPVRSYLRGRNDTVRCIITSLTDAEVGGDLYEELRRMDAKPLENVTTDSDDEEECPDFNWQPPPSINKPQGAALEGRRDGASDILAMLVSIYGSKELFVNEYRLMLADKLLANLDYNTDKEVHTLELLKLRFGEMSMRNCEVMIKDMDDSKRTNTNIHSTLQVRRETTSGAKGKPVTDVAMISSVFWPPLHSDPLKHHPRIQAELDEFSAEYARLKNPRKLIWLDQLGAVELELDVVEDGPDGQPIVHTKEFTCTPLLASIMTHFEDKFQWHLDELSNETGIPEHVLQKKIAFWVNNRVLKLASHRPGSHSSPLYELATVSHLQEAERGCDSLMDEDGHDGKAVSVSAQEKEEMEVYESYIVGMLTVRILMAQTPMTICQSTHPPSLQNLQQLPLDRIHNMLKMFVTGSEIKYNKTPQQLSAFLQHLCKQEKLECGPDGMYKLFKR